MAPAGYLRSLLVDTALAHVMRFEKPLAPRHDEAAGRRMLVAFAAVAIGVFYGLRTAFDAAGLRGTPIASSSIVLGLAAAFFAAQVGFVRTPLADAGLRPFAQWTRRERLYAFQVVPLAAVIFTIVFRVHLHELLLAHGLAGFVLFSLATGLLWGMVQEFLYRGWLQTELTRRFGAISGLIAANLVFTFGPLHMNHLLAAGGPRWGILAAIFGIGLLFGLLYRRSGNVWIPAILHGLWPPNMA